MALLSEAQTVKASAPEGYVQPTGGGDYFPPPPEVTPIDPTPGEDIAVDPTRPSVQDLYPSGDPVVGADSGEVVAPIGAAVTETDPSVTAFSTEDAAAPIVAPVTGAGVTEADKSVADIGTSGAAGATDRIGGLLDAGGGGITGEETALTDEQRVDAELARILGEDSPLLARARADAAQRSNQRGLLNTSMAVGAATGAMVDRALPMAQQNAAQAAARELENTRNRQQASMFTAEQQNQLTALEAELGMQLNLFNADQLNQASRLTAQMRTAMEQQDSAAYNDAAQQLANLQRDAAAQQAQILSDTGMFNADQQNQANELQAQMRAAMEQQDADAYNRASQQLAALVRDAQAQQAELDYRASQAEADAINDRNAQIIDSITRLNQQFLQNMGNADIANIQGTYQQLISTNQAAGSIFQSTLSAMATLMDNPEMTPQQVATGLASMQQMLEASLRMLSNINDMDFGETVAATIPGGRDDGRDRDTRPRDRDRDIA